MIAIPVLRSRVAPVLNWCSTLLIVPRDAVEAKQGLQLRFENADPFEVLRMLKAKAISTLVCGALTTDLLAYGEQIGFRIIYGIAGDLDEVIEAYRQNQLDQPRFKLPGCDGAYRYRRGAPGVCGITSSSDEKDSKANSGLCCCPMCGTEVLHERGVPCSQLICPSCEGTMTRKNSFRKNGPRS